MELFRPLHPNEAAFSDDAAQITADVAAFVARCRAHMPGEYKMSEQGQVALYASCFAAMTLHYLGNLTNLPAAERGAWAAYLQQWQDPNTGLFSGPELIPEEMISPAHDLDYFHWHLTAHVLPALDILGARPAYPLHFVAPYLDHSTLHRWLEARDWRNPWLEGNKLLFMGQFFLFRAEQEGDARARAAFEALMEWLDASQDPQSGLWGTQTCPNHHWAVYGGYHQLLLYYYTGRPVPHASGIVDTVLSIQHPDGGFAECAGGGACEDIDSIDILVNLGKRTAYRRRDGVAAVQRSLRSVLQRRMAGSGFVYRRHEPFMHGGILRTHTPPDTPDLFSTWFGVHTVAVACQALPDHPLAQIPWQFNRLLSMGWHDASASLDERASEVEDVGNSPPTKADERSGGMVWFRPTQTANVQPTSARAAGRSSLVGAPRRLVDRAVAFMLRRVSQRWAVRLMVSFAGRYAAAHSVPEACRFLLNMDQRLAPIVDSYVAGYPDELAPRYWPIHHHQYFAARIRPTDRVLHLGCGSGATTFAVATTTGAAVTGLDSDPGAIAEARRRYRRNGLAFAEESEAEATGGSFDVVMITQPAKNAADLASAMVQIWRQWQPRRLLMRVSPPIADERLLLRRELNMRSGSEPQLDRDPLLGEFQTYLQEHSLQVRHAQILWGVIWAEVAPDTASQSSMRSE